MIFDGHSDVLFALRQFAPQHGENCFVNGYSRMFEQGAVEGGIFVLWADPKNPTSMQTQIDQQLQVVQQLPKGLRLLQRKADIDAAIQQKAVYFLLGAEGLDGVRQQEGIIDWLYQQGVRHCSLTWNHANGFAAGAQAEGGLTQRGRSAVRRIQQNRMLLDVAHLNDRSLRDVLLLADGPVMASHCNSRSLCAHPRNLTDEQIKAIAATGGVIGVNSYPFFIDAAPGRQTLSRLADHVCYMADLVGSEAVGLGLDFNYWDTTKDPVVLREMQDCSQAGRLIAVLQARGFSDDELEQICRENFLRLVRQALV